MRKPITIILALLIALTPVLACAETMNLAALLAAEDNKNLGNETGVYNALYKVLIKANGKDFPLNDWLRASTCLSKNAIGEELSPVETVFDESLSAYEKFFLLTLSNATLSDDEAQALTDIFEEGNKTFPEDHQELYVSTEGDGFITGLIRQALEKMGYTFEPETINETLTLSVIKDKDGKVLLSAPEILTSLPHAILMKHVPAEKKQESALALARVEAAIPYTIDWKKITSGEDVAFEDLDAIDEFFDEGESEEGEEGEEGDAEGDEEEKVELTEEQKAEWIEKWMNLFFVCDAFDIQPVDSNFKPLSEALTGMTDEKPTVTQEPDGGISLSFAEAPAEAAAATTSTKKSSGSSSSTKTKTPAKELVNLGAYAGYTGKYIIYVSKKTCTIAIIGRGSDNRFTKKVKTFPAAIGKAGQTRDGIFWLTKKERWHSWSGGTYSPYSVKQDGGSYIHGPVYTAKDSNKMIASSYNAIGTRSSAGCLSTVCACAGWIYYNCPTGTMVWISNDGKFKAGKLKKIPDDQTYDPTEKNVKPTAIDPATAAATAASAGTSSASGPAAQKGTVSGNGGGASPSPSPSTSPSPSPSPSPTPDPTMLVKKVQTLLTLYFLYAKPDGELDLDFSAEQGQIDGPNTNAAIKEFRAVYKDPTTDEALPESTSLNDLIAALNGQDVVKNKIAEIQAALQIADANGTLDDATMSAIKDYQDGREGLTKKGGVADKETLDALFDIPLTGITVRPDRLELYVGSSTTLTVTKEPVYSTKQLEQLTFKSSDSNVVTIDESGLVTAVKDGTATITVSANDGAFTKTVAVTVKPLTPLIKVAQSLLTVYFTYPEQNAEVSVDFSGEVGDEEGTNTKEAIKAFRKANAESGVTPDDQPETENWQTLNSLISAINAKDDVKTCIEKIQTVLKVTASGTLDDETMANIEAYQDRKGLEKAGILDRATLTALLAEEPAQDENTWNPTGENNGENPTGNNDGNPDEVKEENVNEPSQDAVLPEAPEAPEETVADIPAFDPIRSGSDASAVREIQHLLVLLDYLSKDGKAKSSATDGDYGSGTANAVAAFQDSRGLTATGEVDEATYDALRREAVPVVTRLQDRLIEYGELSDAVRKLKVDDFDIENDEPEVEGVYGRKTRLALAYFQSVYNQDKQGDDKLNEDGMADEATRVALKDTVEALKAQQEAEAAAAAAAAAAAPQQGGEPVPAEQPVEQPAEQPAEQPVEQPAAPADGSAEAPAGEPSSEQPAAPADANAEAPAGENAEAPAGENAEAPAGENAETPAGENAEAPAADSAEDKAPEAENAGSEVAQPVEAVAQSTPEPASAPEPAPEPEPAPAPEPPAPAPEPAPALEPAPAPVAAPVPEPVPEPAPEPIAEAAPAPVAEAPVEAAPVEQAPVE